MGSLLLLLVSISISTCNSCITRFFITRHIVATTIHTLPNAIINSCWYGHEDDDDDDAAAFLFLLRSRCTLPTLYRSDIISLFCCVLFSHTHRLLLASHYKKIFHCCCL